MAKVFDQGNANLNNFLKEQLNIENTHHILEIGFGTGKLINEIAGQVSRGLIEGIDFSDAMTAMARKRNKKYIDRGTIIIKQGDFDKTNYADNSFDTICSTNTVYFWSDPDATLARIFRLLKPGGRLVLGFEDIIQMKNKPISQDVFKFYHTDDLADLLKNAGFQVVEIKSKKVGPMIYHCALATKTTKNDNR